MGCHSDYICARTVDCIKRCVQIILESADRHTCIIMNDWIAICNLCMGDMGADAGCSHGDCHGVLSS